MLWLWCFPVYSPALLICQMISPEAAPASHSFRLQCIVQQLYKYGNVMGGVSVFYSRQKRKLPGMKNPRTQYSSSSKEVCWCGWRKYNEMRNRIPWAIRLSLSSLPMCKIHSTGGRKVWMRFLKNSSGWLPTSLRAVGGRDDTGRIFLCTIRLLLGKLVQFTIHWRMKVPPVDHHHRRRGVRPSSHLLDSSFWNEFLEPIKKKKGKSTAQLESRNKNPSYYNMLQGLYLDRDWATLLSYLLDMNR